MPFFRCDFQVAGDLVFPNGETPAVVLVCAGATSTFRNGSVDSAGAISGLVAEVVGDVASFEIATDELRSRLADQLDILAFVTQSRFSIVDPWRLIEWDPQQKSRTMYIIHSQDARYPPEPCPLERFFDSAISVGKAELQPFVRKALKYYRLGLLDCACPHSHFNGMPHCWQEIGDLSSGFEFSAMISNASQNLMN